MVCTEVERTARIEGGFVLVPVSWLMGTWRACRSATLGIGDFRTLLACREMVARRRTLQDGRGPAYGLAELAKLLGVTTRRAGASVRRLEAAGLIEWSGTAIGFPDQLLGDEEQLVDTIGRGRGSVAIPRRMLRFLAGGSRPAVIATVLGMLLRCLSRRKGGWSSRGRVKASWIAGVFEVDVRRVKAVRLELATLGWIHPEPSGQRAENRWGRAYRIDLAWSRAGAGGRSLPPLPVAPRPEIATPSVNPDPLPEREEDQKPTGRGPAGVEIQGQGTKSEATRYLASPPKKRNGSNYRPPAGHSPAPTLNDIQVEDLKDTGRLLDLHRQAVAKGLVTASENDRLRFVAAAEHALALGKGNPPGLFAYLVRGQCWRYVTLDDEDTARRRLREHVHQGVNGSRLGVEWPRSTSWSPPGLSDDARLVREIRAACIRAGIFRDPWPAFSMKNPAWTRERWDVALVELGLSVV